MIRIQAEDFDIDEVYQYLRAASPAATGAICVFSGLVREFGDTAGVQELYLEHYPGMTEKSLGEIVGQAKQRWNLHAEVIIHRIGQLKLTEQIVVVGVSASHREAAFHACEFIMDYLKRDVTIWKKEKRGDVETWVDAKQSDQDKAATWVGD